MTTEDKDARTERAADADERSADDELVAEIIEQAEPGVDTAMQALEAAEGVYYEAVANAGLTDRPGAARTGSTTG